MNIISKTVLSLMLASGVATAAVATSAQPAQAATFISAGGGISAGVGVSIGAGFHTAGYYAPRYHWYRWHDGFGWHRRWVPLSWVAPIAYGPPPAAFYPVRYERVRYYPVQVFYGRPGYWHDHWGWHR